MAALVTLALAWSTAGPATGQAEQGPAGPPPGGSEPADPGPAPPHAEPPAPPEPADPGPVPPHAEPPAPPEPAPEGEPPPPEPAPDEVPPAVVLDPSPRIRVVRAVLLLDQAEARAGVAGAATAEARLALATAEAEAQVGLDGLGAVGAAAEAARAALATAEADLARAEGGLRGVAVGAYVHGVGGVARAGDGPGLDEQRARSRLAAAALGAHRRAVDDGRRAVAELRQAAAEAEARVAAADQGLDARLEQVGRAAAALDERAAAEAEVVDHLEVVRAELEAARAGDVERPFDRSQLGGWQLPILGPSLLTADELAAYATRFGVRSRAVVPVGELARLFVEEAADEGIRGDVAFAQAVLETGWFTNDDTVRFNNYAGIGHCDSCPTGWAFPSAREGVRAQVQLLESYVTTEPSHVHPLVDRRLRGPAGCCQTWNALTGVWATGSTYGPKVLGIYLHVLEWLVAHRAGSGPPPGG